MEDVSDGIPTGHDGHAKRSYRGLGHAKLRRNRRRESLQPKLRQDFQNSHIHVDALWNGNRDSLRLWLWLWFRLRLLDRRGVWLRLWLALLPLRPCTQMQNVSEERDD